MTSAGDIHSKAAGCWRVIGTSGDRSCQRLSEHVHCRNCELFSAAGRGFLSRPASREWMDEATKALALPKEAPKTRGTSVVVLRVGTTYLGLPSCAVSQVFDSLTVRRIPHTDPALAGLVVLDGALLLCVRLEKILGGEPPAPESGRMLSVDTGWKWVFKADEVLGLEQVPQSSVKPPPATLQVSHTQGVFTSAGREVALLDMTMLEREITKRLSVRGKAVSASGATL